MVIVVVVVVGLVLDFHDLAAFGSIGIGPIFRSVDSFAGCVGS